MAQCRSLSELQEEFPQLSLVLALSKMGAAGWEFCWDELSSRGGGREGAASE